MTLNQIRSVFYFIARVMGDVQAILGGPDAMLRRIGRRILGRAAGNAINKLFRK